jgi:hypothetical protein
VIYLRVTRQKNKEKACQDEKHPKPKTAFLILRHKFKGSLTTSKFHPSSGFSANITRARKCQSVSELPVRLGPTVLAVFTESA